MTRRRYQPRPCSCGTTFVPTGPRGVFCVGCRAARAVRHALRSRTRATETAVV